MTTIDHTHDPAARSWLDSANDAGGDFPIQNLPFGVFRRIGSGQAWRGGVAIGDQVLDMDLLAGSALLSGLAAQAAQAASGQALNPLLAMGRPAWAALRHGLFALLRDDTALTTQNALRGMLLAQSDIEHRLAVQVGDYSDFFTSIDHCANTGRLMQVSGSGAGSGADPVLPNFRWMPIAYHGRASSLVVSGTPVRRPMGQYRSADAPTPVYGPCLRLDFELELGFIVGPGNPQGTAISLAQAEDHLFGVCLLNDWSARDIQGWEMAPLGPFLGKNFATSLSPWIVTLDALAPFRCPWRRDSDAPEPLSYLDDVGVRAGGGLDIQLQAWLQTAARQAAGASPVRLAQTNFLHQYWTPAQMLAHHSVGGCNLLPGDVMGSGTVSGPGPDQAGTMIEITSAGRHPLVLPAEGAAPSESRPFLADGDTVTLRGWCQRPGAVRIGLGACAGSVLPASDPHAMGLS